MPRLAVLGYPVSHSRSPAMHSAALTELGLAPEWTYEAIEVAPEDVSERIASMPGEGFFGTNVTLPHKLAALATADDVSDAAREIGAANTLTFRNGRIHAHNTDPNGVLEGLPRPPEGMRALVMGAGGSARAAIWALRSAGAEVSVWNRTAERAGALAREFGVRHLAADAAEAPGAGFDLLVNATSIGLAEANAAPPPGGQPIGATGPAGLKGLPIAADSLHEGQVVVDLVYGSSETQLIGAARAAGASTVDGLEVLVRQGAASLSLWTGMEPPLDVMRLAARGA